MSTYDNAPVFETGALPITPNEVCERDIISTVSPAPSATILPYPPWSIASPEERGRQFRGMATAFGPNHPLRRTLRTGESDPIAFVRAQRLVERLPALYRRRLLATHAAVTCPSRGRASR
jgi:hypothetical protein